jgi:outer membrane protein assembly factor BamE (lipoprotein component of BamABCDE complex)
MSGAEVITILGSPNIVTTDENRQETWVYDKISTETAYSTTSGGASILILGVGGSAGAASTSQQTLTIVIKFDRGSRVRDFAYHTSRF